MKNIKPKIISLSILGLLLTSCGESITSPTEKPSVPSSTPSIPSVKPTDSSKKDDDIDAKWIADTFKKLAGGEKFAVSYLSDNKEYTDYFANDYVYFDAEGAGYALIKDGNNKKPFLYELNNDGSVKLGLAQSESNTTTLVNSTYVKYLTNDDYSESDFTSDNGDFVTTNSSIIHTLCGLSGWGSYYSYFNSVTIIPNEDEITFILGLPEPNASNISENLRTGTISGIGSVLLDKVDEFVNSYEIPSQKIDDSILSLLMNTTFESKTTATLKYLSNGSETIIGNYSLQYDDNQFDVKQSYSGFDRENYYEKKAIYAEDGSRKDSVAERTYVDHNNVVQKAETDNKWSDIVKSLAYSVIDTEKDSIRKNDDGSLVYVGASASTLFQSVTQFSPLTDLAYLKFKTDSQGTITGIVATTGSSDFYSNGKEEVVVYDIDISSNPSEIVKPTAYADQGTDGADTAKIKNAFDFFSNPTTNFSIDVTEHSSDLNMSLSYEGIYDKDEGIYYYHSNNDLSGSGFFERDNRLYGYVMDSKGTARVESPSVSGHLSDVTTFHISPNCFSIDGDTIKDRDIALDNPLDYMFVGESQTANGYEGTGITMKLDSEGRLSTMQYLSYIVNPVNGAYYPISVKYTYKYGNQIKADDKIKAALDGLDYVKPTTWSEETAVIDAQAKVLFGEDFDLDSVFPYVYKEWLTTNWNPDLDSTNGTITIRAYIGTDFSSISDEEKASFYTEFIKKLKDVGYSEVSNDSTSGTIVLSKEGVPFTVTVNTKDYDFKKSIIITKTQEE